MSFYDLGKYDQEINIIRENSPSLKDLLDDMCSTRNNLKTFNDFIENIDYEFPEDHFLIKGIKKENFTLFPYDRDFVEKDKNIYKWGRDFQVYLGKDSKGDNIYDSVPSPFPDHAILECEVII